MQNEIKFEFTVASRAPGEPVDPTDVDMFEAWLGDVLDSADFGLVVSGLRQVEGE